MRLVLKIIRLIHINIVLLKHGLDKIVWSLPIFRPLNILIIFFPWRWFRQHQMPEGESIRLALEELGPIFVKFGQLLSTRRDLLPDDIANELAKLQDSVPPFPGEQAKAIIEKSLQQPLSALFAEFHTIPLASASISQVHAAVLHDGTKVVVKVLRPNVHKQIESDISLLETFARLMHRYVPNARRFHPIEIVEEIKCTLFDELDFFKEAANASQLRRNFAESASLYIPEIFWHYSRSDVLVMEQVHGIPISDIAALKAHGIDLKRLAENGVEIFFTQVFRDCFFHADMHPGNIFVSTEDPKLARYIAVDFGIMGTLGPEDQHYLGENFLAFFKRDYRRVAELHVQSGWVPPDTRIESFESAIRSVCEPIFERPLKEISFGQTLLRLFQTARRFNMQVQPQLVLLQKTLLTIEGLGRQLYPELDLWNTAKPYLEKWMKKHYGFRSFFYHLQNKLPLWTDKLPELPEAIYDVIRYWQKQAHEMQYKQSCNSPPSLPQSSTTPTKNGLAMTILGSTLVLSATLIALAGPSAAFIQQYRIAFITGGLIVGFFCFFKALRN